MRSLIRFAARLYPRAWKERYGIEFAALLEDVSPDWRTSLDILKGALVMQMRSWNFGRMLAVAGAAGALVALAVSFAMPRRYDSTAVLRMVPLTADQVIHLVQETENRPSLVQIIQTFGLYERERAKTPIEDIVERMKRQIIIRPLDNHSAFTIQFGYNDPVLAQRVTQDLTTRFIEAGVSEALHSTDATVPQPIDLQVLDPANLPVRPVAPNRLNIAIAGLAAGLVIGLILRRFAYAGDSNSRTR
jgi:hypothetical protein